MTKKLINELNNFRKIISENINTLKDLVKQYDPLEEVIHKLGEDPENEDLKNILEKSKKDISRSIGILIEQTSELFETYQKLVKETLGKQ